MANIPVEPKSGAAWLPWLIGIIVLGGLIWLVAELFDNEPDADELAGLEDNVGVIDDVDLSADDADGTLRDAEALFAYMADPVVVTADADGMEGRTVEFETARVLELVGDSAFYIGTDENRRALVVLAGLGESQAGAGGSDGRFNIDEGDVVSVNGTVTRFEDGAPGTYLLPDADRERMLERPLYIRVNDPSDVSGDNIQTQN
jgi:hypothetical protein